MSHVTVSKYMLTLDDIRRVTHTSIETFQGQRAFTWCVLTVDRRAHHWAAGNEWMKREERFALFSFLCENLIELVTTCGHFRRLMGPKKKQRERVSNFTCDTYLLVIKGRHDAFCVIFQNKNQWGWWFFFCGRKKGRQREQSVRERYRTPFVRREMFGRGSSSLFFWPPRPVSFLDEKRPAAAFFFVYILGTLFRFARITYAAAALARTTPRAPRNRDGWWRPRI